MLYCYEKKHFLEPCLHLRQSSDILFQSLEHDFSSSVPISDEVEMSKLGPNSIFEILSVVQISILGGVQDENDQIC